MKVSVELHGSCARATLHSVARRYCILGIQSRMPSDLVNAPWSSAWQAAGGKKSWQKAYGEWMAGVDRERADYRRSLESVVAGLPAVPEIQLKPYKAGDGKTYSGIYPSQAAAKAADGFADEVCRMAGL